MSVGAKQRLLPATCDVVKSLRLEELATQLQQLYQSLLGDLVDLAAAAVSTRLEELRATSPTVYMLLSRSLARTTRLLHGLVRGKTLDPRREAQLMLYELAQDVSELLRGKARVDRAERQGWRGRGAAERRVGAGRLL